MKYTTNSKVADAVLPNRMQCVWQICPNELPRDMHNVFALEMFQMPDGNLVILQLFIPNDKRDAADWFRYVEGYAVYGQIDGAYKPSEKDAGFPWNYRIWGDDQSPNGLTEIKTVDGETVCTDMRRDTARSIVNVMNTVFNK